MENNTIGNRVIVRMRYINVHEVSDRDVAILSGQLGSDPAYREGVRQKQHLLGKWLAAALLAEGEEPVISHKFACSEYGKPYIAAAPSFNISHSGNLVVCAMAARGAIGIDLERLRLLDWVQYKDAFSPAEWKMISSAGNPSFKFLDLWTKKESLLKADGRGLQVPLSAVTLTANGGRIGREKEWYLRPVRLTGYSCYICTEFHVQSVILEKTGSLPAGRT